MVRRHLNPAVTFAQCLTGHSTWTRGGLYVLAQILGAIFGALFQVGSTGVCIKIGRPLLTLCAATTISAHKSRASGSPQPHVDHVSHDVKGSKSDDSLTPVAHDSDTS